MRSTKSILDSLKHHKADVLLITLGTVVIAIGNFTDAVSKISDFVNRLVPHTPTQPVHENSRIIRLVEDLRREFKTATDGKKPPLPSGDFVRVMDIVKAIQLIDGNNGHVLYHAGAVKRWMGMPEESHPDFHQYLEYEQLVPEARQGGILVEECYQRESGYCRQRTGWINHQLALDFYTKAEALADPDEKLPHWRSAFKHAKAAIDVYPPDGFIQGTPTRTLLERSAQAMSVSK